MNVMGAGQAQNPNQHPSLCVETSSGPEWLQIHDDEAIFLPAGDQADGLLDETIWITFLMRSFVSIRRRSICLERVEREKDFEKAASWRHFVMYQFVSFL
jgi:hypothetical protein